MNVSCWASFDSCVVIDGAPYCRVNRGSENENFRQVGFVTEEDKDPKPLFGRRVDRSSAEWKYYAVDESVTYPVVMKGRNCLAHRRGCTEIENGDVVHLQGFGSLTLIW